VTSPRRACPDARSKWPPLARSLHRAQSEEELEEDPEDDGDEEVPDDDVEGVDAAGFAEGESELAAGVEEDVDAGSEEDVVVLRLSLR